MDVVHLDFSKTVISLPFKEHWYQVDFTSDTTGLNSTLKNYYPATWMDLEIIILSEVCQTEVSQKKPNVI